MSNIGKRYQVLNDLKYAYKRWLRMAVDRMNIPPKAIYLELGVNQSTWSRWTDYDRQEELPGHRIPEVLQLLDEKAAIDLFDLFKNNAPERPEA